MIPLYDKAAVPNAEMCLLLAQFAASGGTGAPYARFADDDFDSLTTEFVSIDGYIRSCRIGDERAGSVRSQHASFNPRQVRSLLDGVERDWAQANLHLRPNSNPAMTPYLTDFGLLGVPMYDRVVPKLKGSSPPPAFDMEVTLDTAGVSVARLLQAARVLGDPARIQRARDIAGRIDLFRRGNSVVHEFEPSERALATLPDYLAYADAELQEFLCSSREEALTEGAQVLNHGLDLFSIPNQASFRMAASDSSHNSAPDSNIPQICDDVGESSNAMAIRLAWSYARLLDHSSNPGDRRLATQFRARATAAIAQFADIAVSMGPYTGGYALASALASDDTIILCAGADPAAMANAFAPKSPFRLVAPVAGPVYPELVRKPGYYIQKHGQLTGPLTEDATLKLLPPTLFIGS